MVIRLINIFSPQISPNTTYKLNLSFGGVNLSGTLTEVGTGTQVNLSTAQMASMAIAGEKIKLGRANTPSATSRQSFTGSIDTNNSYLYVNNVFAPGVSYGVIEVAKATSSLYGLVKPDNSTITVSNGVISAAAPDIATSSTVGVVKPDENTIHVDSTGTLSTINMVQSSDITNIVSCTQAAYDALVSGGTVDAHTFYVIIPANNS